MATLFPGALSTVKTAVSAAALAVIATVAVICVALTTVTLLRVTPAAVAVTFEGPPGAVAVRKPVPVIVTLWLLPAHHAAGAIFVILGMGTILTGK